MLFNLVCAIWFLGAFIIWKKDSMLNFVLKMANGILFGWSIYNIYMALPK